MRVLVTLLVLTANADAQSRPLRIATLEYPPFIYEKEGEAQGPLVEVVDEIFRELGIETDIAVYPVSRGLFMVAEGEVDAFFSLKKTEERQSTMLFTETPLIQQQFVFFTRADSGIEWNGDFYDLAGYRIGIAKNTSYGRLFDDAVRSGALQNLEVVNSFELNFKKLLAGRIDLVVNSRDVGNAILRKLNAEKQVRVLVPQVETVESYFAFTRKRDHKELAYRFDQELALMIEDGRYGILLGE